jgi:hypothetical protein
MPEFAKSSAAKRVAPARALEQLRALIAERGLKPFRRQDLAEALLPRLRGVSMSERRKKADAEAAAAIAQAHADGIVARHGHLHWVSSAPGRTLVDGSPVSVLSATVDIHLQTKCPQKWLAVDLETGEVWAGSTNGWRRAGPKELKLLKHVAKQD